jgi:hypothetical protein
LGRAGGKNCLISECKILNNGTPIRQTMSEKLCYFPETHDTDALFSSDINLGALCQFSDEEMRNVQRVPWFATNTPKGPAEVDGTGGPGADSFSQLLEKSPILQAIRTGAKIDPALMEDVLARAAQNPQIYLARIAALQLHLESTNRLDERTNKYISDFKIRLEALLVPPDQSG